jgi:hypothetical protein
VFDLADLHPGDADEVALLQTADIGEFGFVGGLGLESQLGEHHE